jgi:hypothetical protein
VPRSTKDDLETKFVKGSGVKMMIRAGLNHKTRKDGYISGPFFIDNEDGQKWMVTYLPNGHRVCGEYGFKTLKDAKTFVERIRTLTDWDGVIGMIEKKGADALELFKAVRQVEKAIKAGTGWPI